MARVPLLNRTDLPEEYRYLLSENAVGERNIFRAIGHNPPGLQSYMRYGSTLWDECGLSPRERELAILATARALDSTYEWQQHVELARDVGVTAAEIDAIGRGDLAPFDDAERALVAYVRAVADDRVTDAVHEELAVHYDDRTVTGVALLSGYYVATARVLNALAVPVEEEFVGWEPTPDG